MRTWATGAGRDSSRASVCCSAGSAGAMSQRLSTGLRLGWFGFADGLFHPFAAVIPQHTRAGDVDGTVRAGQHAHHETEREVVDDAPAESVQRHRAEEHGAGGEDGAGEGFVDAAVDEVEVAELAAGELFVFSDAVEHDDGVV